MELNGYICDDEWEIAGNCRFTFGKKNNKEYFIKEFNDQKYPLKSDNTALHKLKLDNYNKWLKNQNRIIDSLSKVASSGDGNIIRPLETFINPVTSSPCTASYKVNVLTNSIEKIGKYSIEDKLSLLLTVSFAIKTIHSVNLIHGDLKPDNIIVSLSSLNVPICKVIDFDSSYFKDSIPPAEEVVGTEAYWSPELALYKLTQNPNIVECISCKSDVFALGIIFSQYLTGKNYNDLIKDKLAYQLVCDSENPIELGKEFEKKLPSKLCKEKKYQLLFQLINKMLSLEPDNRPSMEQVYKDIMVIKNTSTSTLTSIPAPTSTLSSMSIELPNPRFFNEVNIDKINDTRIVAIEDMGVYCNVYYNINDTISIRKQNKQTLKTIGWVN